MAFGTPAVQHKSATGSSVAPSATFTSTPTQGNLLVAAVYSNIATAITMTSSGWTALTSIASASRAGRLFWKIAGASESTTVTAATGNAAWDIAIAEYPASAYTVFAPSENAATTASGTTHATPSVTPTASMEALAVGFAGISLNTAWSNEQINSSTTGVTTEEAPQRGSASAALYDKAITSTSGSYSGQATSGGSAAGLAAIAVFTAQLTSAAINESDAVTLAVTGRKVATLSLSLSTRVVLTPVGQKRAQGTVAVTAGFSMALVIPQLEFGSVTEHTAVGLAVTSRKLIAKQITLSQGAHMALVGEKVAVASRKVGANVSTGLNVSPSLYLSSLAPGVADTFGFRLQPTGTKAIGGPVAIRAHVVLAANGIAGLQFPAGLELKVSGAKQASGHAAAILTALQPSLASQKRVTSPVLISYGWRQTLAALTHRSGHPALIEIPLDAYPLAGILTPVIMTLHELANGIAIDETELTLLRIEVE